MIHSNHPVPDTALAFIDAVPEGNWYLFDMSPLDFTGIPAWKAAYFPFDADTGIDDPQLGRRDAEG